MQKSGTSRLVSVLSPVKDGTEGGKEEKEEQDGGEEEEGEMRV